MRAFIQSDKRGVPLNCNFFIAEQGFKEMGIETIPFYGIEDIASCERDDLIVGGVGAVTGKLKDFGIAVPDVNYPPELEKYLGRKVWRSTLDKVIRDETLRPVFVKPIRDKRFKGCVLKTASDFPPMQYCKSDEPVFCSDVVRFVAEWRVFVRYGKILDVRPYRGDWRKHFSPKIVESAVNDFKSSPASCALDFGVTSTNKTLFVEMNDGFSVGCYGLDGLDYAKFLSARWSELTGIKDECDTANEKYRWARNR